MPPNMTGSVMTSTVTMTAANLKGHIFIGMIEHSSFAQLKLRPTRLTCPTCPTCPSLFFLQRTQRDLEHADAAAVAIADDQPDGRCAGVQRPGLRQTNTW